MPKITFINEKKEVTCEEGANLRKVALSSGVELYPGMKRYFNCRGFSQCGECRVYVKDGTENVSKKTLLERLRVGLSFFHIGHEDEVRLACQCRVNGDIAVETQPEFNWFGER